MKAYFLREGKEVGYEELLEVLKQIINRKVINELADDELDKLYIRIYDTAYNSIKEYLEAKNFRIINVKQGMLTASKAQAINNKSLWDEALERKKLIEEGCPSCKQSYSKGLREFIVEDYYPELVQTGIQICKPQYGDNEEE